MNFKIKGNCWSSVFAVPGCVADEHIKNANGDALKVLLYLLRNQEKEPVLNDIAQAAGISVQKVRDAIAFWTESDVLEAARDASFDSNTKSIQRSGGKIARGVSVTSQNYINAPNDIALREQQSPEIAALLSMAQYAFKSCITYSQQASLIWMHDYLGLPADVILTLIEYCVSIGKPHFRYIESIASSWAEDEIVTLEAVNAEIDKLEKKRSLLHRVLNLCGQAGKATKKQCEYIEHWVQRGYGFDLIECAYERCVNQKGMIKFPYINGILEKWYEKGLKTAEEVSEWEEKNPYQQKRISKDENDRGDNQSYDINAFDSFNIV